MSIYHEEFVRRYSLWCEATWDAPRGCAGRSPRAESMAEARELARENGWSQSDGRWVCPAHLEEPKGNKP